MLYRYTIHSKSSLLWQLKLINGVTKTRYRHRRDATRRRTAVTGDYDTARPLVYRIRRIRWVPVLAVIVSNECNRRVPQTRAANPPLATHGRYVRQLGVSDGRRFTCKRGSTRNRCRT